MKPSWHGKHVRPLFIRRTLAMYPFAGWVQIGNWSPGVDKEILDRTYLLLNQLSGWVKVKHWRLPWMLRRYPRRA